MSAVRGFHYALQPVLSIRRWYCEGLQRELAELDAELRSQAEQLATLQARSAALCGEWAERLDAAEGPDPFLHYHHFLHQLQTQIDTRHGRLGELEHRRADLIGRLLGAQRALDCVEQHRSHTENEFIRERTSMEYKEADDLWSARASSRSQS